MPITLGTNIASLGAQRRVAESANSLARVFERLSSGQRINRASDDAAGLAISSSLNASARVYGQALRNINDGISALSIAEGAYQELGGVLMRIQELAEQSANGTYSSRQRAALDAEAQSLASEFNRIVQTTSFNNQQLLSSANFTLDLQVGKDSQSSSRIRVSLDAPVTRSVGDGTLQADSGQTFGGGNSLDNIALADLNGDGKVDIFWASDGGHVGVILGNGDGTFRAAVSSNPGYGAVGGARFSLSDVDGDGDLDYLGKNYNGGFMTVMLNTGTGTFSAGVSYDVSSGGTDVSGISTGDFNGDGRMDVLAVDVTTNKINLILGNGNGTFLAPTSIASPIGNPDWIVTGDLNGDNKLDLTIITGSNTMQVMLGNGDGTFSSGFVTSYSALYRSQQLRDVNGDGALDLIGGDGVTGVGVMFGTGTGSFGLETVYTVQDQGYSNIGIDLADLNSDGTLDIVSTANGVGKLSILLNNGNGTFKSAVSYAESPTSSTVGVADVNGDGVTDVVIGAYGQSHLGVFITNATQTGGLQSFSLLTQAGARSALESLQTSLSDLSESVGRIGAAQARLGAAANVVTAARERYLASADVISSADIASDASQLVRLSILQKAGIAVLSQANLTPQIALRLLSD